MAHAEKDYFTLAEITERWRYACIDEATLLKLATEDQLVFAFYKRDLGNYSETFDEPDGRVTRTHTVAFSFKAKRSERPSLQYLGSDDVRQIFEAKANERIRIRGHYSERSRSRESGMGYLGEAPQLTRDDLLVTRAERNRFEQEHKVRVRPPLPTRIWAWLADQANQRVLMMLSGWITALILGYWAVFQYINPPKSTPVESAPPARATKV